MAKIEKETSESIMRNAHLLNSISMERIWEEIKKSYNQSKNFNQYLNYLSDFGLLKYIFPGVKINTKQVDSKNFIILIANLFLGNSTDKLEVKLVQDFKIDSDTAKKVVFLLELLNLTPEVVLDTYRKKVSCSIDDVTILEWLEVTGNESNTLIKFLEYKPTVSSQELMEQGYKGKELGLEIKRLEIEKFKSIL